MSLNSVLFFNVINMKLLNASEQGLARLKESASIQHKLQDTKNRYVT